MDFLIDDENWEDEMAMDFHKDITTALENAPQLNIDNEDKSDKKEDNPNDEKKEHKQQETKPITNGHKKHHYDSDDDIYGYDNGTPKSIQHDNKKKVEESESDKKKKEYGDNVIQWIYNELRKYIISTQVMNVTNKVIHLLMSDETDDQFQYLLWELLGGHSAPMTFVKKLRNDRKWIMSEIERMNSQ